MNRRDFFTAAGLAAIPAFAAEKGRFHASLAEWSIHKAIQSKKLTNLEFPKLAADNGCTGVEFVNTLWADTSVGYIEKVMSSVSAAGVKPVLIMLDGLGMLGSLDEAKREDSVRQHIKWANIAGVIGCSSVRVNIQTEKQPQSQAEIDTFLGCCTDALTELCADASNRKTNVLVENHGGISSNPDVLVTLAKKVNMPNFGLLPDFGNFPAGVDKYAAVAKMMPYAKAVSFKCFFNGPDGTEVNYDIAKMFKVVEDSKYKGFVGIEYEGEKLSELDGIKAARAAMTKYGLVK